MINLFSYGQDALSRGHVTLHSVFFNLIIARRGIGDFLPGTLNNEIKDYLNHCMTFRM